MFHQIPDSAVVLRSKGVFKQAQCYEHNGGIYAKNGAGFIKLMKHGTSVPNVLWDEITLPFEYAFNATQGMVKAQPEQRLKVAA